MVMARVRKSASSLAWYFSWTALTDSASMRAWAGSYTPQGRSQCALTFTLGANRRVNMAVLPRDRLSGATLLPGVGLFFAAQVARDKSLMPPWGENRTGRRRMREQGARPSWQLVEVTGPSMAPTLLHGDWLL